MKKNQHHGDLFKNLKKIIRIMRLSLFLIIISTAMAFSANSYSQNTKFTLTLNNVTIKDAIEIIEDQSEFIFFYQDQQIDLDRKISLRVTNKTIEDILDRLFYGTKNIYVIRDRQVVIGLSLEQAEQTLSTLKGLVESSENLQLQQKEITGNVSDSDGLPLPGVSIIVKGTTIGTVTDARGNFSLSIPADAETLQFSFVGMKTQEIPVVGKTTFNIVMEEETIGIEEVVAIGYGIMKKSDLTGSISQVKSEDVVSVPTTNILQSLQGRTSGLEVTQNTGAPGSTINVRIRGTNSIQGGNDPLYVVDGFLLSGKPMILNSSDIESIEILKDASATAIYGSRGANGVVLITTKTGQAGDTKVDFETSYSTQTLRKKLELMNAEEYAKLANIQAANDNLSPYFSNQEINSFGEGTDWQDIVFRNAPMYRTSVNIHGGNEKTQFSLGGNIFQQKGIIEGSNYDRYSLLFKIHNNISKKLSVDLSAILTRTTSDRKDSGGGGRGTSLAATAIVAPPTAKPYTDQGAINDISLVHPFVVVDMTNPLYYIKEQSILNKSNTVLANAAVNYELVPNLMLKFSGGIENTDSRNDVFQTLEFRNSDGVASINTGQFTNLLSENTITYSNTFGGGHKISSVAGFTYQNFISEGLNARSQGFLSNVFETGSLQSANSPGIPQSSFSESSIISYLGRVNYSFNDKYFITASLRADGSSRFSEGNKWGYFPSGALAWRMSEESFLKDNDFLSDLKVRTSWGVTGSQAIKPYATLNTLNSGYTTFGDDLFITFAPGTTLPSKLKWETTEQIDIGMDIGLLDNRFYITADYFIKNTRDLLNIVSLPSSFGFSQTIRNVGKMQNRGFEFSINALAFSGKDFNWNINANATLLRNEVKKLAGGIDILTNYVGVLILADYAGILREGRPIGQFYGYVEDGYTDEGKIKYKDLSGDGEITADDKTYIGNPNPDVIFGLNSDMSYKNFDLSLFFQGTGGNDIFNVGVSQCTLDYGQGLNGPKDVFTDHWSPDNKDAKYPVVSRQASVELSDRFVENGSYLRLKNIEFAYNFSPQNFGVSWINNLQLYVSGQNLLTFTKYSWWDPEVNSRGLGTSRGVDHYSYPTAKSFTLGIRARF